MDKNRLEGQDADERKRRRLKDKNMEKKYKNEMK